MKLKATVDNVIIKVDKKIKTPDELLIDDGKQEQILIGKIVACGNKVADVTRHSDGQVCAYLNRVAILPWETDTESFYVVKEENIYGILE